MKNDYIILKIYKMKNNTYKYKDMLAADGFKFNKKPFGRSYWEIKIDTEENNKIDLLRVKYKKCGLRVEVLEKKYLRSSNYREQYFEKHKGLFGKYYICSYCGKILKKDQVSIDHIFPINKVNKSKILKGLIKLLKIENINDDKNLTVSCQRCNSSKGDKTGIWILLGYLGGYSILILKILIIIGLLVGLYIAITSI